MYIHIYIHKDIYTFNDIHIYIYTYNDIHIYIHITIYIYIYISYPTYIPDPKFATMNSHLYSGSRPSNYEVVRVPVPGGTMAP